jgi:hypothetical protein
MHAGAGIPAFAGLPVHAMLFKTASDIVSDIDSHWTACPAVVLRTCVLMMSDVSWNGRLHHTRVKGAIRVRSCTCMSTTGRTIGATDSAEQLAQVVVLGVRSTASLRALAQSLFIYMGPKPRHQSKPRTLGSLSPHSPHENASCCHYCEVAQCSRFCVWYSGTAHTCGSALHSSP